MARPLRVELPDAFYHVMNRGTEKREIFLDVIDCKFFLRLCREISQSHKLIIHSYCLMNNHYHLYVQTPLANLSSCIKSLNERYSMYFNHKYGRIGALFQGRYKSILVDTKSYSLEISRYIHMNPVKSSLVAKPQDWIWSSYPAFCGLSRAPSFLERDWLLSQFSHEKDIAIQEFRKFTEDGLDLDLHLDSYVTKEIPSQEKDNLIENYANPVDNDLAKDMLNAIDCMSLNHLVKKKILVFALRTNTHLSLKTIAQLVGDLKPESVRKIVQRFDAEDPSNKSLVSKLISLSKNKKCPACPGSDPIR